LFEDHFGMSAPTMFDLARTAWLPVIFQLVEKSPLESRLFYKPALGR
jgi:hypothetical protein